MGLFSFFNNRNEKVNETERQPLPEIPEHVFVEKDKPADATNGEKNGSGIPENGIYFLFNFLEKNYEGKGYDDALVNPDNTHLEQNISALKNDLERTIRKVKTFYEDFIRKTDFHINSRKRSGMIDIVEELTVEKETAENHIKQVIVIEEEATANKGIGHGIILSYTRGFRNGLAAISHHSIMKKNF